MQKALLCSVAMLLLGLSAACATTEEGDENGEGTAPAPSEVGVQGALFNTGGTTKPLCPVTCTPFCKTMPSGRRVCGETCGCTVTDTCTCSSTMFLAP